VKRLLPLLALVLTVGTTPAEAGPADTTFTVGPYVGAHHASSDSTDWHDGVVLHDGGRVQLPRAFVSSGSSGPITFVDRRLNPNGWHATPTSYTGEVLDVEDDATATFVLFRLDDELLIAKRTQAGVLTPARTIATGPSSGGSLVVRDGRWWAVWEAAGALWQAGTLGTVGVVPRQITGQSSVVDAHPSLAMWGSGPRTRALLTWDRGPATSQQRDIWLAQAAVDGRWTSRRRSSGTTPSIVANGRIFLAFNRDQHLVVQDGTTEDVSTVQPVDGVAPLLAVTYGVVYVATPDAVRIRENGAWTQLATTAPVTTLVAARGDNEMLVSKPDSGIAEARVNRIYVVAR
jgi:hypothetical protein